MTNVPTIGNTLYRPEREITRPLTIEVASSPSIRGSSWRPDIVGLSPLTIWKNTGM